jgi:hypothetical protein
MNPFAAFLHLISDDQLTAAEISQVTEARRRMTERERKRERCVW